MFDLYKFKTVSDAEIKALLDQKKFVNLFTILRTISDIPGFPNVWLITSIDYAAKTGLPRSNDGSVSHVNSQAVDIVPLTDNLQISLPISLNRNLLVMNTFKTIARRFAKADLPIIAFEADHIHADVLHPGGVAYLNKVRPLLDRRGAKLISNAYVYDAINSGDVVYL